MTENELNETLNEIHVEIQTALDLARQDLLKSERKHKVVSGSKQKLNQLKQNFDEVEQLKIERSVPMWINEPKSGAFVSFTEAEKSFEPLLSITTGGKWGQPPFMLEFRHA